MPAAICEGGTPIAEYLGRSLLKDLGEDEAESTNLRDALMRYDQSEKSPFLRGRYRQLVSLLDRHSTDLHKDLASLPFRLVILATADRMMANAFRAVGKTVQEADYNYRQRLASDVALSLPTSTKPIVYSLFGRHDHPESMVLTDKNLIDYLVTITKGSPPLPDAVRFMLGAPSTSFLFVGFGFTSWWLRLLLRVLDITGVDRQPSLALEDRSTFDMSDTKENQAFFKSAGIYIQAGDWNALARELATRYREESVSETLSSQPLPPIVGTTQRRPLVFLSYASDDADTVNRLRKGLEERGVAVWQDSTNLRAGQNWKNKIEEYIRRVDYFVFVQTENMDRRDDRRDDGVYNHELKLAIDRAQYKRDDVVFIVHVTVGHCEPRSELAKLHRIAIDTDEGIVALASHILESFQAVPGTIGSGAVQST
ncbi:MAG TPA: toll/interleukin-1 receptor domain-containing protein [Vicinamibacterales bacterium]